MEFARLWLISGRGGGGIAIDFGDIEGLLSVSAKAPGPEPVKAVDNGDAPPSLTMSNTDCRVGTSGLICPASRAMADETVHGIPIAGPG